MISSDEYDVFVKEKGADDGTYKGVGCVEEITNFMKKGSREVKVLKCVDKDSEDQKSLGKKTYGDGTIKYGFDLDDTAGKKSLDDAFENKTEMTIKIELDDEGATHSTYVERNVLIKEIDIAPDGVWKETVSLEFTSAPTFTKAD